MGFISQLKAQILPPPGDYLCCPLLQEQIDPTVWTDGMTVGQTKITLLIQIRLKDPSQFPHQKPERQWGLLPIINSLKKKTKQKRENFGPAPTILLFLLSKRDQINKNLFKISSSLIKQSFPSTQLFPIPILYWLRYSQKPNITLY
jgi:hypothetical protein